MTTEPTNADRAEWAKQALATFTARTYSGDHPDSMDRGDLETAIYDLIADLLHFAARQGFDVREMLFRAHGLYEAESAEEPRPNESAIDIHAELARRKQVAIIWAIEDVKGVRPDLTDDQAWDVLQECERCHDCEFGFTWTHIECVADELFPQPRNRGGRP